MPTVLIADRDPRVVHQIEKSAIDARWAVVVVDSDLQLTNHLTDEPIDVAILDMEFGTDSGMALYRQIASLDPHLPVILVASKANSREAIEATRLGAFDYLVKPLDEDELTRSITRALAIRRLAAEPVTLNPDSPEDQEGDAMVGQCTLMQDVYKSIGRVASQNVTVLIRGESGTGKELVARALFQFGNRSATTFMALNCAAIPDALLESELFGHEKGAFTGADRQRIGKFEQCDKGTLFLDEIGDMSMVLQSKLLRVLHEQTFERVGGNQTIHTDVRVISATHRDLEEMVRTGQFRGDLFYRLNGYTIDLPPLRERGGDLIFLLEHFRKVANRELGKSVRRFSPEAVERLHDYSWPGNIRELQSVVRRAVLQTTGTVVIPDFLPSFGRQDAWSGNGFDNVATLKTEIEKLVRKKVQSGERDVYDRVIERVERELITQVLEQTAGNQVEAAALLGITRTTLRAKIARLGIQISRRIGSRMDEAEAG